MILSMDIIAVVCGSHKRGDENHVFAKLTELAAKHGFNMLVTGGADYIDTLAMQWAMKNRMNFAVEYARWNIYGKNAGPARNERILQKYKPHMLIAFSGDSGTVDMCHRAQGRSIPVYHA